jgi:hypothetical protein
LSIGDTDYANYVYHVKYNPHEPAGHFPVLENGSRILEDHFPVLENDFWILENHVSLHTSRKSAPHTNRAFRNQSLFMAQSA